MWCKSCHLVIRTACFYHHLLPIHTTQVPTSHMMTRGPFQPKLCYERYPNVKFRTLGFAHLPSTQHDFRQQISVSFSLRILPDEDSLIGRNLLFLWLCALRAPNTSFDLMANPTSVKGKCIMHQWFFHWLEWDQGHAAEFQRLLEDRHCSPTYIEQDSCNWLKSKPNLTSYN